MEKRNKRQKFVDLAQKRVRRAIKDIRLIGNLSSTKNYEYTDEDIKKIHKALQEELNDMKKRFEQKGAGEEIAFRL